MVSENDIFRTLEDAATTVLRANDQVKEGLQFYDAISIKIESLRVRSAMVGEELAQARQEWRRERRERNSSRNRNSGNSRYPNRTENPKAVVATRCDPEEEQYTTPAAMHRPNAGRAVGRNGRRKMTQDPPPDPPQAALQLKAMGRDPATGRRRATIPETPSQQQQRQQKQRQPDQRRGSLSFNDVHAPIVKPPSRPLSLSPQPLRTNDYKEQAATTISYSTTDAVVGHVSSAASSSSDGGGGRGAATVRVEDDKVAMLVAMDFDPEKAFLALLMHDNNLEAAVNQLLSG